MKVVLKKGLKATDLSTLVVFAAKDSKSGKPITAKLSTDLNAIVSAAQQDFGFTGDRKETLFFRLANADGFKNVALVGLGSTAKLDNEAIRVAGSVVYGLLKSHKVTSAAVHADSLLKFTRATDQAVGALTEGIELSAYEFTDLKNLNKKSEKEKDKKPTLEQVSLLFSAAPSAAILKAHKRAEILVECQNFTRWLGDNPGNYMTPTILANETVKAAKGTGLKVTVWDKARIKKESFGGLLAVTQGSDEDPRFIIMEYNGGGKGQAPICFVGKGLTFDTGGISIKPSASMEEMKYDMCGGAAVIGTMLALARLKVKVNVIGLVPSTENMPGPSALKPGDVYVGRNGKTVEVFNTDAEGRLILGDALAYGAERKPVAMFDVATLTGAILVALGNTYTGVFTRDRKLMKRIQDASQQSGEWVWPMPLDDFHVDDIKGTHADLVNISGGRMAGSSTAAAFLEEFVGRDIPWAHFDIAGTAWNVAHRFPYNPKKGASGVMVRTFVDLTESF
ncbi:MAG: leucyl aminopeptidase [Bdellovibrionales bacterium]|nr:leucyl aminopeptidase [Bdellovibrionales bacterium]